MAKDVLHLPDRGVSHGPQFGRLAREGSYKVMYLMASVDVNPEYYKVCCSNLLYALSLTLLRLKIHGVKSMFSVQSNIFHQK